MTAVRCFLINKLFASFVQWFFDWYMRKYEEIFSILINTILFTHAMLTNFVIKIQKIISFQRIRSRCRGFRHSCWASRWMDWNRNCCKFDDVGSHWMDCCRNCLVYRCRDCSRSCCIHHILNTFIILLPSVLAQRLQIYLPNWRAFLTRGSCLPANDSIFKSDGWAGNDRQYALATITNSITKTAFIFLNEN